MVQIKCCEIRKLRVADDRIADTARNSKTPGEIRSARVAEQDVYIEFGARGKCENAEISVDQIWGWFYAFILYYKGVLRKKEV